MNRTGRQPADEVGRGQLRLPAPRESLLTLVAVVLVCSALWSMRQGVDALVDLVGAII